MRNATLPEGRAARLLRAHRSMLRELPQGARRDGEAAALRAVPRGDADCNVPNAQRADWKRHKADCNRRLEKANEADACRLHASLRTGVLRDLDRQGFSV